jgi:hypothetical protein
MNGTTEAPIDTTRVDDGGVTGEVSAATGRSRALNVATFAHARRLSGVWLERCPEGNLRQRCISIAFMVHNILAP